MKVGPDLKKRRILQETGVLATTSTPVVLTADNLSSVKLGRATLRELADWSGIIKRASLVDPHASYHALDVLRSSTFDHEDRYGTYVRTIVRG